MKWVGGVLIWFAIFCVRFFNDFQAMGHLREYAGKEISLAGNISSEPILEDISQSFLMGRIKVVTKRFPELHYGDKVELVGTLEERAVNRGNRRFRLVYPDVQLISADSDVSGGWNWRKRLINLRRRIEEIYNQNLPEPEASLLAGIVLGSKRGLPKEFWQALQTTSTLHIVVASGYNVTVVLGTITAYLAGWVRRRTAVVLGILAVAGYTVMAGGEAAIVRAAIMGSLAYFGQILGRKADGVRLLVAAVGVMLWVKPLLLWDVGFQLSVMATTGLMFISPILAQWLGRVWLVGKDMSETVAAQIGVWPILVITFGQMSLFGILVNSLILWLVPIVMFLGMWLAVLGSLWWRLGQVMGWLVYGPLSLMVRIVEGFGRFEWMSWQVEGVGWGWGWGYYVVLVIWLWRFHRRRGIDKLTEGDLERRP